MCHFNIMFFVCKERRHNIIFESTCANAWWVDMCHLLICLFVIIQTRHIFGSIVYSIMIQLPTQKFTTTLSKNLFLDSTCNVHFTCWLLKVWMSSCMILLSFESLSNERTCPTKQYSFNGVFVDQHCFYNHFQGI